VKQSLVEIGRPHAASLWLVRASSAALLFSTNPDQPLSPHLKHRQREMTMLLALGLGGEGLGEKRAASLNWQQDGNFCKEWKK
jgi:hypothetical protein